MSENNNDQSSGKFFNGFLLGAALGAGVVFLLGTEKGKKMVRALTDEGFSGLANIIEDTEEDFEDEPMEEGVSMSEQDREEDLVPMTIKDEKLEKAVEKAEAPAKKPASHVSKIHHSAKRFFRGVPKKR